MFDDLRGKRVLVTGAFGGPGIASPLQLPAPDAASFMAIDGSHLVSSL